ncbi:hypothetical protein RFI_13527 [Reticulomyxa filosa]|uniref:Selenoprotein F/M domain-containing protein n=1 Tax=Reticulomyxa filosa TaxID=46433 RepID=X6NE75_RETFI|nr:hypothetical protein RFI_13527 [Reticulomyxa filosa]|eukprot:ETO23652.1 hypothetical protein RFI_13527 [Reticulomyxa filosa]
MSLTIFFLLSIMAVMAFEQNEEFKTRGELRICTNCDYKTNPHLTEVMKFITKDCGLKDDESGVCEMYPELFVRLPSSGLTNIGTYEVSFLKLFDSNEAKMLSDIEDRSAIHEFLLKKKFKVRLSDGDKLNDQKKKEDNTIDEQIKNVIDVDTIKKKFGDMKQQFESMGQKVKEKAQNINKKATDTQSDSNSNDEKIKCEI